MASSDETFQQKYVKYCTTVGHLFTCFARLENGLASALKMHLAQNIGGDEIRALKMASAIYGSMRFKASRDTIKRVLAAEKAPVERIAFVEAIFEQVGHIEGFRDKIAHQMVLPAQPDLESDWQVSDAVTTRDITKSNAWTFLTSDVLDASLDLADAATTLGRGPKKARLFAHLPSEPLPAWRYKSSALKLVPRNKWRPPQAQ